MPRGVCGRDGLIQLIQAAKEALHKSAHATFLGIGVGIGIAIDNFTQCLAMSRRNSDSDTDPDPDRAAKLLVQSFPNEGGDTRAAR